MPYVRGLKVMGWEAKGHGGVAWQPKDKTKTRRRPSIFVVEILPRHMLADNAHFQGINHGLQVSLSWSISCHNEAFEETEPEAA